MNAKERSDMFICLSILLSILCKASCQEYDNFRYNCSFQPEDEGNDLLGQVISLSCLDENNMNQNQSVNVNQTNFNWYRLVSDDAYLIEEPTWLISKMDNGVMFVCAEDGDSESSEPEVLCHITPLEIPPSITLERSIFESKGNAMFVCKADGFPEIKEYNWFIDDVSIDMYPVGNMEDDEQKVGNEKRKVELYSDNVIEITGLSSKDRGMIVSCEAVTSTGVRARENIAYSVKPQESSSKMLTSDKIFLLGFVFAGGVPVVFAVIAGACWVVRGKKGQRERALTMEEEDLAPEKKSDSLPRSIASGVTSDMPANAVLYRSHSIRSTKEKVGPMSQLVLPPIGNEGNRASQHIYDEAPHFATSELALSRGKHTATLPAKTYTSRSSLYRMSADYADVPMEDHVPANYENVRSMKSTNGVMSMGNGRHGHPNATLPAMKL